ncbi:T9SS type A sorting domain-containing protein [Flavicella sediminum]|uniref:T9SS type A sorting domain-containing protein n=1 Tax=Flavicella sediminum TaxID=2585141 RepID=UPI00111DF067|nr:T9SS type A sorting domain-containing protein [Flavicella sediminum]
MKKNTLGIHLFLLCLFCLGINIKAQELYVSTTGSDSNDGSKEKPLATLIGARDKARTTGAKTIYIRGGRYNFDSTCVLDAQDSGVTFTGYNDERVIFDGSKFINPEGFELVTDDVLLAKLHNNAQGKVYSKIITDNDLKSLLNTSTAQISVNDKMATLARFPNIGFATINRSTITGEVKATEGTNEAPKGAEFKLYETMDAPKWNAEIGRLKKMKIKGYISADWLREEHEVSSVSTSGSIRLRDGAKYGMLEGGAHVNRLFFYNLLCELDEPGEWFYDPTDSRLYLWPRSEITKDSSVGVWAGPQCFEINDGQNIQIKKMTIQNVGKGVNGQGAINVKGFSKNVLIAGVTFRYIAQPLTGFNIYYDVRDSKVLSCDFYDMPGNRLYGGKVTSTAIEHGNNSVENCHFTQVYSKDYYGGVGAINGAGNIFKNNLFHNINGQPVNHSGVDHVIELNEAFNVGIEEGDGGVFYTGADMWSFGNVIRHNFVHHIMSVPKLLGRAAFFSDDFDAGEEVSENVVYKGGWESLKMNKGGGHDIVRNVILECYRGIRNGNSNSSHYTKAFNYLATDPLSNAKENYIGRMLKAIGTSGWETTVTADNWTDKIEDFWLQRYPKFKEMIMAYKANKNFRPYASHYDDNMFYGNHTNILGGSVETKNGNQNIDLSIFENPSVLNFKFREPRPSYAPKIPFGNIGLYIDNYRCAVPSKDTYRQKVKERFSGQPSHDSSASYDYKTINERLYYNSGEMIFKLTPCMGVIEETGDDSFTITAISETCIDKSNGQIQISAKNQGNYEAVLNGGSAITFTNEWAIANLAPGAFDLCITNTATSKEQCFSLVVDAGGVVAGKTSSKRGVVEVAISKGTAPYEVLVNGEQVMQTHSSNFEVSANQGDLVEVKTSVVCEGGLSQIVSDFFDVFPNPSQGQFEIAMGTSLTEVYVSVYNVYGKQVSSKMYSVDEGRIQLDIQSQPNGVYFATINLKEEFKTLKIIKK